MKPDQDDEVDNLPPWRGESPLETVRAPRRSEALDDRTQFAFETFMLQIDKRRILRAAN
jgi:hypothetical protein